MITCGAVGPAPLTEYYEHCVPPTLAVTVMQMLWRLLERCVSCRSSRCLHSIEWRRATMDECRQWAMGPLSGRTAYVVVDRPTRGREWHDRCSTSWLLQPPAHGLYSLALLQGSGHFHWTSPSIDISSHVVQGERPKWYQDKGKRWYSSVPRSRLTKKCKVYDELILRKIIEIVATRCHVWKLKYTKFDFGWGSAQTLLTALPDS